MWRHGRPPAGVARGLSPSDRGSARGRLPGIQLGGLGDGRSVAEDPLAGPSPALAGPRGAFPSRRCARPALGRLGKAGRRWLAAPAVSSCPCPHLAASWGRGLSARSPLSRGEGRAPAPGATVDRADCPQCAPTRRVARAGPAHVKKRRQGSAAMSATHPTRLETRTKESNARESEGSSKPVGMNESEGRAPAEVGSAPPWSGAPPARLARTVGRWSVSARDRTRKMVNYAWAGRSQRKLWWRPVAVLRANRSSDLGIGAKD
ncbi:hypothetical protein Q5P01_000658 [Channa striata]|uniref:Uncharacterized protein n=1 Tax=Channa striata TaxID=64152 RepID=A0AA88LJB4_CHASR|nr:hypothetical protein Q5P01_000658 [Channa striata]